MAEYSRVARGSFVSNGQNNRYVYLPFRPSLIRVFNNTILFTPSSGRIVSSYWDSSYAQGSVTNKVYSSTGTSSIISYLTSTSSSTNGITTFKYDLGNQFGPKQQIVSSTKGSTTLFMVPNHGYSNNDVVIFENLYQNPPTPTTGMPQMCGMPFAISVSDSNHFFVIWDTTGSNYTALSGSPAGAVVQKILDPNLYCPNIQFISAIIYGTTTSFTTTTSSNLAVGSVVSFRIPKLWAAVEFNYGLNPPYSGTVLYGKVLSVNGVTVFVDIDSSLFTPFTVNIPVSKVPGLSFPQMIPTGDVNNGGPIPSVLGIKTINASQAISGSFINNTSQGFILGSNTASGNSGDNVSWEAYYYDITVNG